MRALCLALAGTLALCVTPAVGQQAADAGTPDTVVVADSVAVDSLARLFRIGRHERWYVRLTTSSQAVYTGYVFDVNPDSQYVHVAARRAMLPAIDLVELRHKDRTGALIGTIVGAAVLAAVGYNWDSECDVFDEDLGRHRTVSCDAGWPVGMIGLTGGAIIGGLVGAVIAPGTTRWEEIWRARE